MSLYCRALSAPSMTAAAAVATTALIIAIWFTSEKWLVVCIGHQVRAEAAAMRFRCRDSLCQVSVVVVDYRLCCCCDLSNLADRLSGGSATRRRKFKQELKHEQQVRVRLPLRCKQRRSRLTFFRSRLLAHLASKPMSN